MMQWLRFSKRRTQCGVVAGQAVQVRQLLADLRGERLDRLLQAHDIGTPPLLHRGAQGQCIPGLHHRKAVSRMVCTIVKCSTCTTLSTSCTRPDS